jgi:hypothetical protein
MRGEVDEIGLHYEFEQTPSCIGENPARNLRKGDDAGKVLVSSWTWIFSIGELI